MNLHQINMKNIDLFEMLKIIVKHKNVILISILLPTIMVLMYILTLKPIYKGSVLLEIGSIVMNSESTNAKPTIIQSLESVVDLREVIKAYSRNELKTEMKVEVPAGSTKLVYFIYEDRDATEVKNELQKCIDYTLKRHSEKAGFYKTVNASILPTMLVENILIEPNRINKGFIIIMGLLIGFTFGICVAFLLEYVNQRKEVE